MGGLRHKIENQAKLNDRRFGKGIVCRLITDPFVIDLLNRSNLIPLGTKLNGLVGNTKVSYDATRGIYFALPITVLDKLEIEIANASSDSHGGLLAFLRQNMVMARIPVDRCPSGKYHVDPNIYDILIETTDVSETLDAMFVNRNKVDTVVNRLKVL